MRKFIIFTILFFFITLSSHNISEPDIKPTLYEKAPISSNINTKNMENNGPIFTSSEIPKNIYENMLGKSIPFKYKEKIDINTLSYLQISYFGFDGNSYIGEMIVNSKLSNDVLEIFEELYDIKYPIEKIKLIDEYDANDELSMSDNNTSCFCYRVISGTSSLSNHAKRLCNRYKPII